MSANCINDLLKISNKINSIMEKTAANANFEFKDQDARLVALSGMQEAVISCAFWLRTYDTMCKKSKDKSMILEYTGSHLSLEKTEKIMLKEIRLGLVIFFHFKLENLLGILLNIISNKKLQGILNTFTELSQEIKIDGIKIKKDIEIIKSFSSIRNSLHNNGIHNKETFSVKVGALNYDFIKDGVVRCASIDHIINLIKEITDIVDEILNTDKVKGLKEMIHDTYADWLDKFGV
jgi:hypothetical protein